MEAAACTQAMRYSPSVSSYHLTTAYETKQTVFHWVPASYKDNKLHSASLDSANHDP